MLREWAELVRWRGLLGGSVIAAVQWVGTCQFPTRRARNLRFVPGRAGVGQLQLRDGLPILELQGSPAEMGRQHGQFLAGPIKMLHKRYLGRIFPTNRLRRRACDRARRMLDFAPAEYAQETAELAAAAGITPDFAILTQAFLDILRASACSTLTVGPAATQDGQPLFGRTLDFPDLGVARHFSLLTVFRPTGRRAFAAMTWPGLLGPLTAMNADGLCLADMTVSGVGDHFDAAPYLLLYRQVLEQCGSVPEAEDFLRSREHRLGTTNNVMLMDAAGRSSVGELQRGCLQFRRPSQSEASLGGLWSTNHFVAPAHKSSKTCRRWKKLASGYRTLRRAGPLGVAEVQQILHTVNLGGLTLQAMVMEPARRVLHFAFDRFPATAGRYRELNLAELLAPRAAERNSAERN